MNLIRYIFKLLLFVLFHFLDRRWEGWREIENLKQALCPVQARSRDPEIMNWVETKSWCSTDGGPQAPQTVSFKFYLFVPPVFTLTFCLADY